MKNNIIKILLILGIILVLVGLAYVGYGIYKKYTTNIPNPVATIEVEDYGTIKVELYPDIAPNTVTNFIRLANRGFFNGLTFHRTIPNFVIQGGAKGGDGVASPALSDIYELEEVLNNKKLFEGILKNYYNGTYTSGDTKITSFSQVKKIVKESENRNEIFKNFLDVDYNIDGEFIANGDTKNNLKHEKGVISMARSDYSQYGLTEEGYNSSGSQFFIMTKNNSNLDGLYTGFGKVIDDKSLEVVDKIANVKVHYRAEDLKEGEEKPKDKDGNVIEADTPKKQPVIKNITIETYGVDYGAPETHKTFDMNAWMMQQYGMAGY